MAGGEATNVDLSRKFVSETELDEKRKKRQEEWEKVRKPEDPEGKKIPKTTPCCSLSVYLTTDLFVLLRGARGGVRPTLAL